MKTGYQPDRHLTPWTHHRAIIGAAKLLGDMPIQSINSDLIDVSGGINEQSANENAGLLGESESCVGWYTAEAIGSRAAGLGYKGDCAFAGGFPYTAARKLGQRLDGEDVNTDPADAGTAPSLAASAVQRAGLPTKAACPYTGPKLNLAGSVDGAPRAGWILSGYAAIVEPVGPDLRQAVNQALALRGMNVGIAIFASPSFNAADGTRILSANDFTGGAVNHEVELVDQLTVIAISGGKATLSDGTVLPCADALKVGDSGYLLRNHWNTTWSPNCPKRPGTVYVDQYAIYQAGFIGIIEVTLS